MRSKRDHQIERHDRTIFHILLCVDILPGSHQILFGVFFSSLDQRSEIFVFVDAEIIECRIGESADRFCRQSKLIGTGVVE